MSESLDQKRAKFAWDMVGAAPSTDFVNLAKGFPAMVMSNGLMQSLAFLQSKGKSHHKALVNAVCGWVGPRVFGAETNTFPALMEKLHRGNGDQYQRATDEALEFLRWVRQFAAARQ